MERIGEVPEGAEQWRAPEGAKKESPGFMRWAGNRFRAVLPAAGFLFAYGASNVEAAPNAAREHLQLRDQVRNYTTAAIIKEFLPETVQASVVNGQRVEKMDIQIKLGDRIIDLYKTSGKWESVKKSPDRDFPQGARDTFKQFSKQAENQVKDKSILNKIREIVSNRILNLFGNPADKESRSKVGETPIEEATINTLRDEVVKDALAVHGITKGLSEKTSSELMSNVIKTEAGVANLAVAQETVLQSR